MKCPRCGRGRSASAGCPDKCPNSHIFDEDTVASLNDYQISGVFHPFTCSGGGTHPEHENVDLIATTEGWKCPVSETIVQDWFHSAMGDWSWTRRNIQTARGKTWDRATKTWK